MQDAAHSFSLQVVGNKGMQQTITNHADEHVAVNPLGAKSAGTSNQLDPGLTGITHIRPIQNKSHAPSHLVSVLPLSVQGMQMYNEGMQHVITSHADEHVVAKPLGAKSVGTSNRLDPGITGITQVRLNQINAHVPPHLDYVLPSSVQIMQVYKEPLIAPCDNRGMGVSNNLDIASNFTFLPLNEEITTV